MHDITIVTVHWNAPDFLSLLLESVDRFASEDPDVVVVDNGPGPPPPLPPFARYIPQVTNVGHGTGLNTGLRAAGRPYCLVLDIDCHLLRRGWEGAFREALGGHALVGGRGVAAKPLRPAVMFMTTAQGIALDWRATAGYRGHRVTPTGFDVAVAAYHTLTRAGAPVRLLESRPGRYGTLNGEEWLVGDVPYVYHHWHGSHLDERAVDFPGRDLHGDRDRLLRSVGWRLAEHLV